MGFFNLFKTKPEAAKTENRMPIKNEDTKTHNHNVTGVSYYEKNVLKLAHKNPLYDLDKKQIAAKKLCIETIYQYTFSPTKTELIPELTNPFDPSAIKVLIDGQHVGYIKAGSCAKILKLINEDRIARIESEIYGGNYKMHWNDGIGLNTQKEKDKFRIKITIFEK